MQCSTTEESVHVVMKERRCYWDNCNTLFFDVRHFVKHVEGHMEGNPIELWSCKWYKCPHKNRFKHRYMLQRHLRTHTRELPFHCDNCSAAFSTRENLNRHDCGHTGRLPYPCRKCHKRYARTSERSKCEAAHAGKKYTCSMCGKIYTDSGSLRRHRRREHGVTERKRIDEEEEWMKEQVYTENVPQLEDNNFKTQTYHSESQEGGNSTEVKITVEEVMQTVEPWIILPSSQEIQTTSPTVEMRTDGEQDGVQYIQYTIPASDATGESDICGYSNIDLPHSPTYSSLTPFPEGVTNTNMPVNLSMVCNKYERPVNSEYILPPIHTLTISSLSKYIDDQPLLGDLSENSGPLVVSIDGALDLTSGHGMPTTLGETEGGVRCGCGAIDLSTSTEWTPEPGFSFTSLLNSNLPYDPIDLSSAAMTLSSPLPSFEDFK